MHNKTKIFAVLIIITLISFIIYIQSFGFEGKEIDFYVPAVTGDNISSYKISCSELNLSQVSKDPSSLIGKKVKVTGQIYEKEEIVDFDKTRTSLVLKVPNLSPDPYILVTYTGKLPFKQDNNITVYGEYHYPAQDKTLPEIADKLLPTIHAGYIEKGK
jgi:hypothetical protein